MALEGGENVPGPTAGHRVSNRQAFPKEGMFFFIFVQRGPVPGIPWNVCTYSRAKHGIPDLPMCNAKQTKIVPTLKLRDKGIFSFSSLFPHIIPNAQPLS